MTIGLFIDGAYILNVYPGHMDYVKLRNEVETNLGVIDDAYFFTAVDEQNPPTDFHRFLGYPPPKGPGFQVKQYWLSKKVLHWPEKYGGGPVVHPEDSNIHYELITQKAVDVGLAFHMVASYHQRKWDTLVLFAGDGDFHEPVQYLVERHGINLFVIGKKGTVSTMLLQYGNLIEIDKDPWRTRTAR